MSTPIHLFGPYNYREATPAEFGPYFMENRHKVFSDTLTIMHEDWLTEEDKVKLNELNRLIWDRFTYRIFILRDEEIIGWHVGRQLDTDSYYMTNTAIYPEYQNQGIYSALLPRLLAVFKEKGFQKISSKHIASNNAVIVAKLKAGFVITGMKIDEKFGVVVVLSFIYSAQRLSAYKFRTGQVRPDEEIKKYL